MMPAEPSISIERWLEHLPIPRHWAIAMIALALFTIPFICALADNALDVLLTDREGWFLFFPPVILVYFLLILAPLERSRHQVASALRPVLDLDDETFDQLVAESSRSRFGLEIAGMLIGAIFILIVQGKPEIHPLYPVSTIYSNIGLVAIFVVIGWYFAIVIEVTALTRRLLREPLQIDILDIRPFESIGRQCLLLSLILIGSIVLSLLFVFSPSHMGDFLNWENLVIYGVLFAIVAAAFFVGMYDTHKLLAKKKTEELANAHTRLIRAYEGLKETIHATAQSQTEAVEFTAWTAAYRELQTARTWPYNTEMIRTLLVSGLIPLAVAIMRIVTMLMSP